MSRSAGNRSFASVCSLQTIDFDTEHKILTPISLLAFVLLLVLLPLAFGQLMFAALAKLYLSPEAATIIMIAIIVGGFINIPVKRFVREEWVSTHPLAVFGLSNFLPQLRRVQRQTVIAVNMGGCIIPTGLAFYELIHIGAVGGQSLLAVAAAVAANTIACYLVARPVAGVGIVMPSLVSPFVAAIAALLLAPQQAAPVAFVAGVGGPLIGADLLHLKEIRATEAGMASIGGAGTFDGIVLSGIIAAYLA